MNSNLGIICLEDLLRRLRRGSSLSKTRRDNSLAFIENIDHFKSKSKKTKHSLIALSPADWSAALRAFPNIKFFNCVGLTYEMVKALNENGYTVDIIDFRIPDFKPAKRYDLFIGHGGHCKSLIERLEKQNTVIAQYVSGAYRKEFLRQSQERYDRVCSRKGIAPITSHVRSLSDQEWQGEEYLTERAKHIFTANCPRMIKGYGKHAHKMHAVGWAAYVEDDLIVKDRDFDRGRKGFIYVAGTSGNIQKGLDLILEAFARTPDLCLYIYCDVEKEVRTLFRKELSLPNVQYVYHYRFGPLRTRLRALLKRVNFTITAPIDTGIGTAFLGSLGLGLIPVGYADMLGSPAASHLADSWHVEALVNNIRGASQMPVEWCQHASELTMQDFRDNMSPQAFGRKFSEFLRECSNSV